MKIEIYVEVSHTNKEKKTPILIYPLFRIEGPPPNALNKSVCMSY